MTCRELLARLHGVTRNGAGWQAKCPAHEDKTPSLSVREAEDGKILIHCHARCTIDAVCDALGISLKDLMPPTHTQSVTPTAQPRIAAIYSYVDENKQVLFQVCRYDPKNFRQRRTDPDNPTAWLWSTKGIRRVPYRLPGVLMAVKLGAPVYIVEGEKDVETLKTQGLFGTCNAGGSGRWQADFADYFTGGTVIIIADKDEPGRKHARQVAASLKGKAASIKVLELPDVDGKPVKDSSDYFAAGGTVDQLKHLVDATPEWTPEMDPPAKPKPKKGSVASEYLGGEEEKTEPGEDPDEETFARLAALSVPEFERVRKAEADRLGFRPKILEELVKARRPKSPTTDTASQGTAVEFPDLEPWPDPVDGVELLDELQATLKRFVVAPDVVLDACALFALHTYSFDLGDCSPILFISGPTKRCGKTRLLSVLSRLVSRPLTTSSASAPGMYRVIERCRPTLLIDEVDSFMRGDDQLRGLVNSGHTRDAAFHLGCGGRDEDFAPKRWSTWCPKIFSGIGKLAATIEDRAIIVRMLRKRRDERTERLRYRSRFEDLRRKCARWVADHTETIRVGDARVPEALNDRAVESWTPLLILADLAGGHWPSTARRAALELSGDADSEPGDAPTQLLADIERLFRESGADRLSSEHIAEALRKMEGREWAEWGKARKPISTNQIAKLLKNFRTKEGIQITSRGVRIGDATLRGYPLEAFEDAFARWLPDSKYNSTTTAGTTGENPLFGSTTPKPCCTPEKAIPSNKDGACCTVVLRKPVEDGKTATDTPDQTMKDL